MKRFILSILAVFAIAAAVVGCGSSNTSSGNTELQGTWKATSPDETVTITVTFSGNSWTMTETSTSASQSVQLSGTFTLDSAANPKTIDMLYVSSVPATPGIAGTTVKGIYQITGNNLMIATADTASDPRPTELNESNSMPLTKQ